MKRLFMIALIVSFTLAAWGAQDDWMKKSQSNKNPAATSKQGPATTKPSPSGIVDLAASPTPVDYYNAGETYFVFASPAYFGAIASDLKNRMAQHRETFVKIQASADALAAFDRYVAATQALPLKKLTNDWPANLKDAWTKEADAFCTALRPNIDNVYFWLGYEAIRFSWALPHDIKAGFTVDQEKSSLDQGLGNLAWITQQPAFSVLSADLQAQVKGILELKTKAGNPDDPMSGGSTIAASDIEEAGRKATVIRQAAKNGKLVG